jgi:hypothetical protein
VLYRGKKDIGGLTFSAVAKTSAIAFLSCREERRFRKMRRVELLDGSWKTAPNHSRPATCGVEADIDAEDQLERDPQEGH